MWSLPESWRRHWVSLGLNHSDDSLVGARIELLTLLGWSVSVGRIQTLRGEAVSW